MTVADELVARAVLLNIAVNAVRAVGCDCGRRGVNVSDEYAKPEPCDICGALAFLEPPDMTRIPKPIHRPF